ncbi:GNAT family N-acetyltransferase [Clostridium oryzae]|uniref:Acetyltransferase (GNAT) family protein n=1 Tax=Clostridium oryzae TaxID=1450648 RepID=A0A1V4IUV7_9CLOT|nr:GNAT family N-acetyltransferase [Clostridium oryzae]OPJ63821.1 acetyltransferase (GNAT) family protein [Clostridium oryzae]
MNYELKKLSISDGRDIYDMLQEIAKDENGFINTVNGMTFEEYKEWLISRDAMSKGIGLEDWQVPSNTYWLFVEGRPVGTGKLRHFLTDKLRAEGGHAGYAIRKSERNKGYGTILLKMLIEEAKKMNIEKILLTVRNGNTNSIKVALNNNGRIENVNEERYYIWIDC